VARLQEIQLAAAFVSTLLALMSAAGAPAAPTAGAVGRAESDPVIFSALVGQGHDALRAGAFKAARDAFLDALSLDKKNPVALEGAGTAYLQLQDFPHARPLLEQAAEGAGTGGGGRPAPSRSLVLNLASVHVRQKNPMRAAKLARDFLAAHPDAPDEQVLSALGIALSQADEAARKGQLFRDAVKAYETATAKLESTRPGMKRWGVEWVPQAEWSSRDNKWKAQQSAADQRHVALVARRNELARVQKELTSATRSLGVRRRSPGEISLLRRKASGAAAEVDAAQKQYDDAMAAVERPKFPPAIPPVPMEMPTLGVAAADAGAAARRPTVRVDVAKPPNGDAGAAVPAPRPAAVPPPPPRKARVVLYAAAFAVAPDMLVTAASALEDAGEIVVQSGEGVAFKATVLRRDEKSGLALLRVHGEGAKVVKLTPLPLADASAAGPVSCVSFPSVNIFDPTPERIDGTAPALKDEWTVRLLRHPRLPGGPLLSNGKVVGVELASRDADPARVPAATLDALRSLLGTDAPNVARAVVGGADPVASVLQLTATRESGK
jgi:tetratricopeptide (TPR) repeat protein